MKRFFFALGLFPIVAYSNHSLPALIYTVQKQTNQTSDIHCLVVKVSDGDTFTCRLDNQNTIQVRLADIDAPESGQAYGNQAKKALNKLIYNKQVQLEYSKYDKYGRTVATVFLPSSNNVSGRLNVNLAMIESGYAHHYKRYSNNKQYANAQKSAQAMHRGLWADKGKIIKPEEWRHK